MREGRSTRSDVRSLWEEERQQLVLQSPLFRRAARFGPPHRPSSTPRLPSVPPSGNITPLQGEARPRREPERRRPREIQTSPVVSAPAPGLPPSTFLLPAQENARSGEAAAGVPGGDERPKYVDELVEPPLAPRGGGTGSTEFRAARALLLPDALGPVLAPVPPAGRRAPSPPSALLGTAGTRPSARPAVRPPSLHLQRPQAQALLHRLRRHGAAHPPVPRDDEHVERPRDELRAVGRVLLDLRRGDRNDGNGRVEVSPPAGGAGPSRRTPLVRMRLLCESRQWNVPVSSRPSFSLTCSGSPGRALSVSAGSHLRRGGDAVPPAGPAPAEREEGSPVPREGGTREEVAPNPVAPT